MPKLNFQNNFTSKTLFQTLPSRLPYYNTEKTKNTNSHLSLTLTLINSLQFTVLLIKEKYP